jgi:hypothetical protein
MGMWHLASLVANLSDLQICRVPYVLFMFRTTLLCNVWCTYSKSRTSQRRDKNTWANSVCVWHKSSWVSTLYQSQTDWFPKYCIITHELNNCSVITLCLYHQCCHLNYWHARARSIVYKHVTSRVNSNISSSKIVFQRTFHLFLCYIHVIKDVIFFLNVRYFSIIYLKNRMMGFKNDA